MPHRCKCATKPLQHWKAGPGKKVAIVGMGGLGHMGVKIAHAMGAEVTVLSQSLSKQEDGLRFGAAHYYATNDASTFDKLAGTFDLIICTVGAAIDWNDYLQLLKVDGTMTVVGVPDAAVPPIILNLTTSESYKLALGTAVLQCENNDCAESIPFNQPLRGVSARKNGRMAVFRSILADITMKLHQRLIKRSEEQHV